MDDIGKALVELVRTGAPLAEMAIRWYYITQLAGYASWLITFAGMCGLAVAAGRRIFKIIDVENTREHERKSALGYRGL